MMKTLRSREQLRPAGLEPTTFGSGGRLFYEGDRSSSLRVISIFSGVEIDKLFG